jgi:hypothetical protein
MVRPEKGHDLSRQRPVEPYPGEPGGTVGARWKTEGGNLATRHSFFLLSSTPHPVLSITWEKSSLLRKLFVIWTDR